ncbi:MAG: hypothetical protein KKB50_13545 [Planctomycetes bacterium]|nr:hypothetical protein [Planctomycetota bacterium]
MRDKALAVFGVALAGLITVASGGCGDIVDAEAEKQFLGAVGQSSLTVFPAFVRNGEAAEYDPAATRRISEFLLKEKLAAQVHQADQHVPLAGKWHHNQARMFRESATTFGEYVVSADVESEYALLAEYLIGGRGAVDGIHCYVVDQEGRTVFAVLLNSHHKPFSRAKPQSPADCTEVLVDILRDRLRPAAK